MKARTCLSVFMHTQPLLPILGQRPFPEAPPHAETEMSELEWGSGAARSAFKSRFRPLIICTALGLLSTFSGPHTFCGPCSIYLAALLGAVVKLRLYDPQQVPGPERAWLALERAPPLSLSPWARHHAGREKAKNE